MRRRGAYGHGEDSIEMQTRFRVRIFAEIELKAQSSASTVHCALVFGALGGGVSIVVPGQVRRNCVENGEEVTTAPTLKARS